MREHASDIQRSNLSLICCQLDIWTAIVFFLGSIMSEDFYKLQRPVNVVASADAGRDNVSEILPNFVCVEDFSFTVWGPFPRPSHHFGRSIACCPSVPAPSLNECPVPHHLGPFIVQASRAGKRSSTGEAGAQVK